MSTHAALIIALVRRRKALGFSQARMAELMHTSQSAVARLETGKGDPRVSTLARYAEAVGLSLVLREQQSRRLPEAPVVPVLPPESGPTWRQRKILQVIRDSLQRHGYPPSHREIADYAGLASVSAVAYQLRVMQDKGLLTKEPGQSRSIRLAAEG